MQSQRSLKPSPTAADHQPLPNQPLPNTGIKALFYVVGDAEPGLLGRIIEPVAKLGYVPARVHASAEDGDGSKMTVDLRVSDVEQSSAERMENALRSIVGVHQVIAVYERP